MSGHVLIATGAGQSGEFADAAPSAQFRSRSSATRNRMREAAADLDFEEAARCGRDQAVARTNWR